MVVLCAMLIWSCSPKVTPPPPKPTANINKSLIAYYPFNGNANDKSGNGHNGKPDGCELTTDRFGNENSAYLFSSRYLENGNDKRGDDINLGNSPALNPRNEFTICAWINANSVKSRGKNETGWKLIVTRWDRHRPYELGYHLAIDRDQKLYGLMSLDGASAKNTSTVKAPTVQNTDVWTFVCFTASSKSNTLKLYADGVLVDEALYNVNQLPLGNVNTKIGSRNARQYSFDGKIDDVRFYSRVLNECEIEILHKENPTDSELKEYSNCDSYIIK